MVARFFPLVCLVTLLVASLATAPPATASPEDPTYRVLRDASPDGRHVEVADLVLERDAHRFTLEQGTVHFLSPVDGRTIGAVFVGEGSYVLNPASEAERRHLAFVLGERGEGFEVLHDRFDSLVLWFADDTDKELMLAGTVAEGAPAAAASQALEKARSWQREDLEKNLQVRLLQDLLDVPGMTSGAFFAFFDGRDELPPSLALVDPRGLEALGYGLMGGEDTALMVIDQNTGGFWYASDRHAEVASGRHGPFESRCDAQHYEIETTISATNEVSGVTRMTVEAVAPVRVMPVSLAPPLRLEAARFRRVTEPPSEWVAIPFIQEDEEEDADAALVLPEPLTKEEVFELEMVYAGEDILVDGGDENFYVGARTSWYPNAGIFGDPATFELTYQVPAGRQIVSVGEQVEVSADGSRSVWRSAIPIRVAGFNYGDFEKMEQRDEGSGMLIQVFTNPGTPDVIRELNSAMRSAQGSGLEGGVGGLGQTTSTLEVVGPELGSINTTKLAESALVDGINAARVGAAYFGALPQKHVAITQQSDWAFGQSWPSLIYMPYLAFLTGSQRNQLGLGGGFTDFVENVGYHELAHQWWGHLIGWQSYRDQWLSEGFSEFHAALTLQHVSGWEAYVDFWDRARDNVTSKVRSPIPAYEVGPITQGLRVATSRSPAAYSALVYSKGGFVLHMLRMMMWDPSSPEPDARFITMMKDFTSTYAGQAPSTADFQAIVERHMVPAMNAAGDGTIDWFFDQWVYGSDVPRLTAELEVDRAKRGTYRIQGEVVLSEVGDDFRALVPLWVDFGRGEMARIGLLPMIGPSTRPIDVTLELPKKPKAALVNARREILARD